MSNRAGNLAKDVPKLPRPRAVPARDWATHAACAGHDTNHWFLDQHDGTYTLARAVCETCPVRQECLDWALATHTNYGLWGGLNPIERRRLRYRHRRQEVA